MPNFRFEWTETNVLVRTKSVAPLDEEAFRKLGVEYLDIPCKTEEEFIAAARYADVVLTFLQSFTRKVIRNLEKWGNAHQAP